MQYNDIINTLNNVKNGTFCKICYASNLPVKATFKKQGIEIRKITTKRVRFGVDYDNINTVIERKALNENKETIKRADNFEWIIEDKLSHNKNTGKNYVRFANCTNSKPINDYVFIDNGVETVIDNLNDYADYIIPSYFKEGGTMPEVQNVCVDNIIAIKNV